MEPLLSLQYSVSLPQFQEFSLAMAEKQFAQRKKKNRVSSILQLVVALLITLWVVVRREQNQIVWVLCVALVGFSVYSFAFYRYLFPGMVRKNAAKSYGESGVLQHPIHLTLYPDRMDVKNAERETTYPWGEISAIRESGALYGLELGERKMLLLSKAELGEDRYLLEELFDTLSQKYEITRERLV